MPHSLLLEQAAALLGVSRRTIYYRIREGRLRTVRTPGGSQRVLMESIESLLAEEALADAPSRVPAAGASDTALSAKSPAP